MKTCQFVIETQKLIVLRHPKVTLHFFKNITFTLHYFAGFRSFIWKKLDMIITVYVYYLCLQMFLLYFCGIIKRIFLDEPILQVQIIIADSAKLNNNYSYTNTNTIFQPCVWFANKKKLHLAGLVWRKFNMRHAWQKVRNSNVL